jgi:CubicO group peptidase (beta-lactamase class C family)
MILDRRQVLAGGAATLFGRSALAEGPRQPSPAERAKMAEAATAFAARYQVPGLAIAVARGRDVLYDEAFGFADTFAKERLTPAHRFRIASVSKPITSTAVFTLIEQGRLRLGDRVFGARGILGDRFGAIAADSPIAAITLRHLLTHTAGGWSNSSADPMFAQTGLDHAGLIAWTLANRPLGNPPGAAFAYSNFGYCLAGRVIEAVTGQGYADYVQAAVLKPTGALDMSIAGNGLAGRQPGEVRYHKGAKDDPYALNVARMDSHGGWIARASAIARFAAGLENVLKPASIAEELAPSSDRGRYAKGWRVSRGGNAWHGGHLAGTTARMVRAKDGLVFVALLNTRHRGDDLDPELDKTLWAMVRSVPAWNA